MYSTTHWVLAGRVQQCPCRCAREKQTREKPSPKRRRQSAHANGKTDTPETTKGAAPNTKKRGQGKVWNFRFSPFSPAPLFTVGVHPEVPMPRVDDHRVQPLVSVLFSQSPPLWLRRPVETALLLGPTHEFYHFSTPAFVQRRNRGVRASS